MFQSLSQILKVGFAGVVGVFMSAIGAPAVGDPFGY